MKREHLLAFFAVAVLAKIPSLLEGRLWAEDGFFLVDALRQHWWQALLTPHTGYIDVTASGAMVLATHIADLEHVAIISVLIALLVQCLPAILLATCTCPWLRPPWALAVALLLVLAPPSAEEVWLSPVTGQYHLMVCVAIILAFNGSRLFHNLILVIASLSGPGPLLMGPLFVLRAALDRSWHRAIQAGILSVGAMIEIAYFCTNPEPNRHLMIDPSLLASVVYIKHLILPFFGLTMAALAEPQPMIAVLCVVGLGLAVVKTRGNEVRWLYAAAMTMLTLSYLGALGNKTDLLNVLFGQRYYYAPQVLIGLTLLGVARIGRLMIVQGAASVLVGWLIVVGVWQYHLINPMMVTGPSWRDQVAQWRRDHRPVMVWPATIQIVMPR